MLRSVLLALLLSVIPATAFANECPSIMAAIDAALPTATLAEPDMTKVKELRTKGEELPDWRPSPQSRALGALRAGARGKCIVRPARSVSEMRAIV